MANIKEILERNPVIPALKNEAYLDEAIESGSEIVFVIMANILNIKGIVTKLKAANKIVYVHMDMIDGISSSNNGVEYLMQEVKPDGIITTKHNIVAFANKKGIKVIQRFFILDSFSLENTINHIKENKPSAVEILPGLMPKIIKKINNSTRIPVITGGLVNEKEDVINALAAGAVGVSTTYSHIWDI
ncbi:glycerol-3-phosphate responsive antiterminator [Fusobacterium sp. SYSU M8D902]|uniref:glycerol-3-phosphate responsive antiterminator n=1 Tax=Fusobacterium sp. SYSU M8D902 TaxID=3159562 RepID=UPI0032E4E0A3